MTIMDAAAEAYGLGQAARKSGQPCNEMKDREMKGIMQLFSDIEERAEIRRAWHRGYDAAEISKEGYRP